VGRRIKGGAVNARPENEGPQKRDRKIEDNYHHDNDDDAQICKARPK